MAIQASDYGDLLLQSRDRHLVKRHISLFGRRRMRKTVNIARNPLPWVQRHIAAQRLRAAGPPSVRIEPDQGYALIPRSFIKNLDPIIAKSLQAWQRHRDRIADEKQYFFKLSRHIDVAEFRECIEAALQEDVLRLAVDYLGGVPILDKLDLWWTRPWNRTEGAQNYHLDSIPDTRSIRFLIAVTEVDEDAGPLHFVSASKSAELVRKLGYLGGIIGPDLIQRELGHDAIMRATSEVGAGIAFDASRCFHMGSRDMKKDRLMLSFTFCSWYVNEAFRDHSKWLPSTSGLTQLQRLVLNIR